MFLVGEAHEGILPSSQAPLAIWHFDFYRFNDPQEFEEAGFRDLFASTGLKIAEWPNQAQGMLPLADLQLTLTVNDQEVRQVQGVASTLQGQAILKGLLAAQSPTASHANSKT